jgi:hypothetical protein
MQSILSDSCDSTERVAGANTGQTVGTNAPLFTKPIYEDGTPVPLYGICHATHIYYKTVYTGRIISIYNDSVFTVLLPEGKKLFIRTDDIRNTYKFAKTDVKEKTNIAEPIELVEFWNSDLCPNPGQVVGIIHNKHTFYDSEFNLFTFERDKFEDVEVVGFTKRNWGHYNSNILYTVKMIDGGEERTFSTGEFLFRIDSVSFE